MKGTKKMVDEKIKKGLSRVTSDFAQPDIDFIKELTYPTIIKFTLIDEVTNTKEVLRTIEVEDLDDLLKVFKLVEGPCVIELESMTGVMELEKMEEK